MSITDYLASIDDKRRPAFQHLFDRVTQAIPVGFECVMQYNMPTFVVPLDRYPAGYHVSPNTPLPFISLGVQKQHIAIYHLGLTLDTALFDWFVSEYAKVMPTKLNIGKSCIRFTNVNTIPIDLIEQLVRKLTVVDYLTLYETSR
ncbi:DUF1801 domain-containing protein [Brochothrix campestris]|uniref:YdhG-like domain-containing protein n=1 Tax=Brochothrix campestris FSL F6-1037 TaxID=1265861 RepID=W7CYZ2_9LIST|nr:DUF1801 domain-containing protein [Brochothrix campestris]EUJ42182.1 hypothetical protein BCAMP_00245 [Brochothrix campestris FSL F6-1037]